MNKTKQIELNIELSPWQEKIESGGARFNVIRAGRQAGKTFYATFKTAQALGKRNSVVAYVGPTFSSVKKIVWERMKRLIPRNLLSRKPNETDLSMTLKNGSMLYLLGSDNVDTGRGLVLSYAVVEEAALQHQKVWTDVLRPALTVKRGGGLFISTPKGFNWFKDIYDDATTKNDPDWAGFHFTMYDNPYITKEEIKAAHASCLSEATWRQEYLAEFEAGGGRVFEDFSFERHIVDGHAPPKDSVIYRGIDWGLRDATACVWLYLKSGVIHVYDCYAQSNLSAVAQAQIIQNKRQEIVRATALSHDAFKVDPELKGMSIAATFVRAGIENLIKASMNKGEGINLLRELFRQNRINIHSNCVELIKQLTEYEWSQMASINEKTDPGCTDDVVDALRYACQLVETMGGLGDFMPKRKEQKLYDVGGVRLPLIRNPQRQIKVDASCGKVYVA